MALLRNREVTILGKADAADASPVYTVSYPNGNRENVKLNELQLTEAEYKDMLRQNGEVYMHNVQKIEDKDLQELRDSQNPEKIQERQKQEAQKETVEQKQVKVSPTETEVRKVVEQPGKVK